MKSLFAEFGSPQAVAAAYNGGEDSLRRWIAWARSNEVDRLVSEMVMRETKDYVFKVVKFHTAYRERSIRTRSGKRERTICPTANE